MHYLGQLPDLPLPHTGAPRLRTRRRPLAQIVLCQGCCCGQTDRGLPAVPLDWLKPIWKAERLNKSVQLSVSGCLGPCDLPNVCTIITPEEQVWYGRLTTREDYAVLLAWARRCREQGALAPLPTELEHLRFERWPGRDEPADFQPVAQDPADIVLLTAADTELLTWSAAAARLPAGFPSIRALNLDKLRDQRVFDAYLDDVLQEGRVIVVRALGGLGYWREALEAIRLLAMAHRIAFVCLPGDNQPDAALAALGTVPLAVADQVLRYCAAGGVDNAVSMLRYLADELLGTHFGWGAPVPGPEVGLYHPQAPAPLDRDEWQRRFARPGRPTAAVAFYRAHWTTGNLAPIDALLGALEGRGLNAVGVFGPDLASALTVPLPPLDVLISTTSFHTHGRRPEDPSGTHGAAPDRLTSLDVPVLQAIFCSSAENVWAANIAGLSPRDLAMNVALPEFDGRIITTAVSFKSTLTYDGRLQTDIVRYQPRADRIDHVACLAERWARLRHKPNAHKRVAIILANYPSKNARVGNAVGLDTPASLHRLLVALRHAGYNLGPEPIPDGQQLIERVIALSVNDAEFARRPLIVEGDGPPGLRLGNVLIAVQPSRGYDQDPAAVYHSPDLPPPPYYTAFYRSLRDGFGADAVVHLGKHGNLEWLPGKSVALSATCYPEAVLDDLPNVYPYIINNPGEGTQAKRRTAAVIVDHLIPPMTHADTYGELRQLEALVEEYHTVQGLDPAKAPLVLERIRQLVADAQLHRDFDLEQPPSAEQLPELLGRIDGYLCELKEAQIRDGLHVLGQLPDGEQLTDLLAALVRVDNGPVLGLAKALATDLGFDYAALLRDPAAALSAVAPTAESIFSAEALPRHSGGLVTLLHGLARELVQRCRATASVAEAVAAFERHPILRCKPATVVRTKATLSFLWESVWPRLQRCADELTHLLAALSGRFVPPGPSGAPTRGTADVLPTGRNFYSLDVRAIPTPTAWQVGCAAANALLERHRERCGVYPESVALVVWGTSNMRTGGDDIAQVLYLLGVKPRWDEAGRRVVGLEALPLVELGRPRIDVTIRISGLFRDAFPGLVRLLNDAVELVAGLEEPLEWNYVRAHIARDTAVLSRTVTLEEASRRARLRVFGSKPGAYGAGLLPLIDGRNWQSLDDLANVYLTWSSYAYTGRGEADGAEERDAFRLRLAQTQVVAQNQDNREHDIFDSDDYFQFHGGLIAAIRAVTGAQPEAYLSDTSRPEAIQARTLREEAYRVFRARVVNPRWLAGVMRHGYKGAVEMAATVDYLFGYDATADVLDDWMYERLAQTYLLDQAVARFLRQANPWAERAMIERLLEAAERGLWQHPEPETMRQLSERYGASEAWLEGMT
ncbi:MAG: cobaltochelatase subunit CobN [Gemmataceae bacterium]|nr:cobaltochelatase subunit CobN [Gemmataceae bacterium]MDW8265530.1 cobaltochelatase subunit CobN [Gemmataceae bacterium]